MSNDQTDFEDFLDHTPRDLGEVQRLAKQAVALEMKVQQLEDDLKSAKAALLTLRRDLIPDAMAENNLSEFRLEDGSGVKVVNFAAGSLPKTPVERLFALRLLEEHGGDALIKTDLTVSFEKKDHNRATSLAEELKSAGYDAVLEASVHHMQLAAWCKEKAREGAQIDFEKLGVYIGRDIKITLPTQQEN
jgi:hypothetical protein